MIRHGLSQEQWADIVTLFTLSVMWWVMVYFELKRTWKWTALGQALTVLTVCLAISYTVAAITTAFDVNVWVAPVRWTIRLALFGSGVVVISVLAIDNPDRERT